MRFTKMHGAGNDFVVLDAVEQPLGIAPEDLPELVSRLCDRHTGVGADGVMRGDVAFDEVEPIVAAITPVPGGVGAVTSTVLARHVVQAASRLLERGGV